MPNCIGIHLHLTYMKIATGCNAANKTENEDKKRSTLTEQTFAAF